MNSRVADKYTRDTPASLRLSSEIEKRAVKLTDPLRAPLRLISGPASRRRRDHRPPPPPRVKVLVRQRRVDIKLRGYRPIFGSAGNSGRGKKTSCNPGRKGRPHDILFFFSPPLYANEHGPCAVKLACVRWKFDARVRSKEIYFQPIPSSLR